MGKNLIQQRRGRGLGRYRSPSHRFRGRASYTYIPTNAEKGVVVDIIDAPGRSAPLALVDFDGRKVLQIPHEGMFVGQEISFKRSEEGSIVALGNVTEGRKVFNIELSPGDGGKMCRSSGSFATVIGKERDKVVVELPSKEKKTLSARCRVTVGSVAGTGRTDKPFLKAGYKYHAKKAYGKRYPHMRGVAMNAVDHPFGGSTKPGKHKTVSRHKPPGAKVGSISPRRTGRKKK